MAPAIPCCQPRCYALVASSLASWNSLWLQPLLVSAHDLLSILATQASAHLISAMAAPPIPASCLASRVAKAVAVNGPWLPYAGDAVYCGVHACAWSWHVGSTSQWEQHYHEPCHFCASGKASTWAHPVLVAFVDVVKAETWLTLCLSAVHWQCWQAGAASAQSARRSWTW